MSVEFLHFQVVCSGPLKNVSFQVVSWWLYPQMSRYLSIAKIALLLNVLFVNDVFFQLHFTKYATSISCDFYKETIIYNILASGQKQIAIL